MIRTTIDDAQTRLKELVDAALRGEEVVITTPGDDGETTIHPVGLCQSPLAPIPMSASA